MSLVYVLARGAALSACVALLGGCLEDGPLLTTTGATSAAASTGADPPDTTGEQPTAGEGTTGAEPGSSTSALATGEASTEPGTASTGEPTSQCGDGVVEAAEVCDDGDQEDGDECPGSCEPAFCGDGYLWMGIEACDDGNKFNDDACTNACTAAICGDGVTHTDVEECDDGNEVDTDFCTSACATASCGDQIVLAGVEACDDGNQDDSDGCTSLCKAAACGDGLLQVGEEGCDDGNQDDSDACTSLCEPAVCGDGLLQVDVEGCDDGNNKNTDPCLIDCTVASCGDGFVQANVEQCDDKNKVNADLCSKKCFLTPKTLTLAVGQNTAQYGSLMLGTAFNDSCPVGQVLTGFSGIIKLGAHATLKGQCGAPMLAVQGDAFVVKTGAGAALPSRGGAGDTPWTRNCPVDQVLVGFSGSAGAGVNQLVFSCAPLVVTEAVGGMFGAGTGAVTQLPVIGAPGGMAFPQTNCPMGQVVSTQRLRATTVITAFGVGCSAVGLGF